MKQKKIKKNFVGVFGFSFFLGFVLIDLDWFSSVFAELILRPMDPSAFAEGHFGDTDVVRHVKRTDDDDDDEVKISFIRLRLG